MNVQLTVQVPRTPDLDRLIQRFNAKLQSFLFAFKPDLVQLQGRMQRHTEREGVVCQLNLHLPTGQLSSERNGPTAQQAFRGAGEELLRQINKHKEKLRETRPHWRGNGALSAGLAVAGGPTPEAEAHRRQDLRAYLDTHLPELQAFVARQVRLRERRGELPAGRIEPAEVLDEVVVAALSATPESARQNRGRWFLLLAAQAIRRLSKTGNGHEHGLEVRSLDQDMETGGDGMAEWGAEWDAADEEVRLEDTLPASISTPEDVAATDEMIGHLETALAHLPAEQRSDLVLHLIEGFDARELARLSHRRTEDVRQSLAQASAALRALPDLPPVLKARLGSGAVRSIR